jgi:sodium-dependent phosphate cotransporter
VSSRLRRDAARLGNALRLPVYAVATLLLFLFAVRLLGTATDAARPVLERLLRRIVVGDVSALGLGWLASYALANGSVVAALALSLFDSGILSAGQLFVMVAGTRLGGSAVVVFVGALDYVQKRHYALQSSVSMGILTFLLTHSIYLPATAIGYASLPWLRGPFRAVGRTLEAGGGPPAVVEPATRVLTARIGAAPTFVLAVALLFVSLRLFDALLDRVETATLRRHLFVHFERTWLSFGLGVALTVVTTSVAFSLGVVVPLYNRGYVERDELVPYVLGANIGTLADTIVVAAVLGSPVGVGVVTLLVACSSALTLVVLVSIGPYGRSVAALDDRLLEDRRAFVVFVASLVAVPLALLLVPLLLP